jgi:Zn-dependent peptidase ImmA (M78 family)/DNA-binding XRE family transcriptional regulator
MNPTDPLIQRPWDDGAYQRFAEANIDGEQLVVRFENGDEVRVNANRLLGVEGAPQWGELEVSQYELRLTAGEERHEVAWVDVRALDDASFAGYLAERAAEEARQVGHRLRSLRERRNLSSRELAERAGINPQSLSRIERGRHDVVFSTLQRLLAAMNYDLADLSGLAGPSVPRERVLTALGTSGLSASTITRILSGAPDSVAALRRVRQIFNWSPTDVAGPAPPPALASPALAGRFKQQTRGRRSWAYVMYAHEIARLADRAARRPRYDPPQDDAGLIANDVRSRYGDVGFEALARYCWDIGIVVVPLLDPGEFHGACWLIDGRPVIVLKQRQDYAARWVFDLAHELRHVLRHLGDEQTGIVELSEIGHSDDEEEIDASGFAGDLLLGDPDQLAQMVVTEANGVGQRLKAAVQVVARKTDVDVGVLANYLAYRLTLQRFPFNFWSVAANLQQGARDAAATCRGLLLEHLDWANLNADETLLLRAALATEDEL